MQPEERDPAYLWDMLQAAREVEAMVEDQDLATYLADRVLLRAIERSVEIIGEAARRVSAPYLAAHPEILWRKIIGQRNILAHEYGQIDHALLYKTAVEDIPALNGTKLRRLFLCRAEFIRPVAVGGYPHCGYIRIDRWNSNVVGRMNSTLQWAK